MTISGKTAIIASGMMLTVALTGCTRSLGSISPRSSEPQRLPSAPVDPVQSAGQLPPPTPQQPTDDVSAQPETAPTAPETQIAAVEPPPPPPSSEPVTREGVSGTWNVKSDNPDCRMVLAFTKWSGGYRATSLRCNSPELSGVSAWDVNGSQVVLMDSSGNTLARLNNSGGARYDGTTAGGKPISFTR